MRAVQVWAQAVEKAGSLGAASGDRVRAQAPVRHGARSDRLRRRRAISPPKLGCGIFGRAASTCRWNDGPPRTADRLRDDPVQGCCPRQPDQHVAAMLEALGIRGRLLLAFFGVSALAVLATAVAVYAFLQVGLVVERHHRTSSAGRTCIPSAFSPSRAGRRDRARRARREQQGSARRGFGCDNGRDGAPGATARRSQRHRVQHADSGRNRSGGDRPPTQPEPSRPWLPPASRVVAQRRSSCAACRPRRPRASALSLRESS